MGKLSKTVRQIRNNLLSTRAVSVLGPRQYCTYLGSFFMHALAVARTRNLHSLDRSIGRTVERFRYRNAAFYFDCRFCDEALEEESYAFGIAREIYIRDCYLKWLPSAAYENARSVVDLGANRGAFSALMTTRADYILCVECGAQYVPVISHNMTRNGYRAYAIETSIVGTGGLVDPTFSGLTMNQLISRHRIQRIDLLKMDIEGSEFALFEQADWLEHVRALTMEVHPAFGDPDLIVARLKAAGFAYVVADEDLRRIDTGRGASFIYGWRQS